VGKSLRAEEPRGALALRIWFALAIIASLAWPAFGQTTKAPPSPAPGRPAKTQREIEEDKAADRAYQKSLRNIPDQPPADPWGSARSTETPKTAAKSKSATKAPAN
jgi:hypothetical protein